MLADIACFLSNRWQCVKVNGSFSGWSRVTNGVPQGSVLGPLLFLIYINDMPELLRACFTKLYADNSKVFGSRKRNELRVNGLQRDLTSFELWCSAWQLSVNAGKCEVLSIVLGDLNNSVYTIGGQPLTAKSSVKDLGVIVDSRLNFNEHISRIVSKASSKTGMVYRAFTSRNMAFMVKMFMTHIRPILEYNCEIWSPASLQNIDLVERVQRRFTKRIGGLHSRSYPERLSACGLEPLELRRIKRDLVFVFKLMKNLVDLDFDDYFTYAVDRGLRGNCKKLYPKYARVNVVLNSFNYRVVNVWNSLPDFVVLSRSLNTFKSNLNKVENELNEFLKGRAFTNP